jgi:anti-sigma factor RsiW
MPCEHFQDALIEAAATRAEPQGEVRVHLQNCAACQAAFEQEQSLFASIDAGVRVVANAEVPPSLMPRVRAALDEMVCARGRRRHACILLCHTGSLACAIRTEGY